MHKSKLIIGIFICLCTLQKRAELERAKMINSTIGKDPEKSNIIINNGVDVIKDNNHEK